LNIAFTVASSNGLKHATRACIGTEG